MKKFFQNKTVKGFLIGLGVALVVGVIIAICV